MKTQNEQTAKAEHTLRSELKWAMHKLFFMQTPVEIFSQRLENENVYEDMLKAVDSLKTSELASTAKELYDIYASAQQQLNTQQ